MSQDLNNACLFTIHYDGARIINHKMKLDSFIESINGFNELVKSVAKEMGIPPENVILEILPIESGGVKAKIAFALVGFVFGAVGNNITNHLLDDIKIYERLGVPRVVRRVNQFLDRKKSVSDYKNLQQLTIGLDIEANRIMMNKQVHMAAEQFASALEYSADILEISSTADPQTVQIIKADFPKLQNPFIDVDIEENIYEEQKILKVEGIRYSKDEWIFYERNEKGGWDKEKEFRAVVLDVFLLSLGRDNSLKTLKDKNLYCTVRCKEIVKPGNKKKTIERAIIRCRLTPESLF